MIFSEKNTEKIHGKWKNRTFFVRTLSVLFAAVFSVQILLFSGCTLFHKKKSEQFPQQALTQQTLPQTASAIPASEPLDPKYAAFKPVLPPQNSKTGGYAVPTDNIVDNIFGKSTVQNNVVQKIPQTSNSTVKPLPLPESVKDKPAAHPADKLADKVPEQPVSPQKTPAPEPNKNTEKPLPPAEKLDTEKLNPEKQDTEKQNTEKKPEPPKEFKAMAPLGIAGVLVSTDTAKRQTRIEISDSILFQPNSWTINPDAEKHLRKIAGEIRACYPEAVLDIEGHTDNIDRDPVNKTQKHDIASFKSMTVMQYFVKSLMWDASKITSSSYGSGRPVGDNGTPEGRARNNRIEIVVKS